MSSGMCRASDYEEYLGGGRWQVYKGNPRYCQVAEVHEPHEFRYVYLDNDDLPTRGSYYCDGIGIEYPERPGKRNQQTNDEER